MKNLLKKYERLIRYGVITLFITIVDVIIVRLLSNIGIRLMIANTAGVVTGSLLQYIWTIKYAFRKEHTRNTFMVHVGTFLLGLFIANTVIVLSYEYLLHIFTERISFFGAKFFSITTTFFLTYILRLTLYQKLDKGA